MGKENDTDSFTSQVPSFQEPSSLRALPVLDIVALREDSSCFIAQSDNPLDIVET